MGIPVALKQRTNSICKEGSGKYAEEKTKLVPGEGSGPNVCRLDWSGWLPREDAFSLSEIYYRFSAHIRL